MGALNLTVELAIWVVMNLFQVVNIKTRHIYKENSVWHPNNFPSKRPCEILLLKYMQSTHHE